MTHVVIVGGGPAGLSAGAELAERGVPFTILDRDGALAGLRALDPQMQLLTPPPFSQLPGMTVRPGAPAYEKFGDVVRQFEAWRARRGLEVVGGANVDRIERDGAGFVVRCGARSIAASHVVNATGIIAHPAVPAHGHRGAWQHSLTVRTEHLAAARRLVVVGAGMSAAEVIERWLDVRPAGACAWLSTRRPVVAVPHRILGVDIHWLLWGPEHAPGRLLGRRIGPARDLIIGRSIVRALRDRTIRQVPPIAGYEPLAFADGTRADPDLLVFATGYRYGAEHLGDLVELDECGHPIVDRHSASTRANNLYVLGLRFGRSVASSALRGIVRDARHVADRIARDR